MKRIAFYVRVSTQDQTCENQLRALHEALAGHPDWQLVETYRDDGVSGAKGRDKRPGLDAMLNDATRGRFDMLAAWSVDRIARSLPHLVGVCSELKALRIGLYLHTQAIDTSTPAGEALLGMMGVFAQLERALIVERVHAGLARARAKGTRLGKAATSPAALATLEEALRGGAGLRKAARLAGVGTGTAQRVAQALRAGSNVGA